MAWHFNLQQSFSQVLLKNNPQTHRRAMTILTTQSLISSLTLQTLHTCFSLHLNTFKQL
jgi:hypothetical protein